jgi:hypothetical protein
MVKTNKTMIKKLLQLQRNCANIQPQNKVIIYDYAYVNFEYYEKMNGDSRCF